MISRGKPQGGIMKDLFDTLEEMNEFSTRKRRSIKRNRYIEIGMKEAFEESDIDEKSYDLDSLDAAEKSLGDKSLLEEFDL